MDICFFRVNYNSKILMMIPRLCARHVLPLAATAMCAASCAAFEASGTVYDSVTGESLIGVSVYPLGSPGEGVSTGLDGSFSLRTEHGGPQIVFSYPGYESVTLLPGGDAPLEIRLVPESIGLEEVVVHGTAKAWSEAGARSLERKSAGVINVLGGKALEIAPDITVGNIIQRMSGVSVERNSTGEGQYAIMRGMDKRYNYITVGGVKIASPDNKNRFVPLDMFPSDILARIEVSKSLTADLEGDGIGGAINLVMREAPSTSVFSASLSTGYNALFLSRDFLSFNHGESDLRSPNERKGADEPYGVSASDFSMRNLRVRSRRPLPDLTGSLTYGNRFFGSRLGITASASYQNLARGKESEWYWRPSYQQAGIEYRHYSERRTRTALHLNTDLKVSANHSIAWYNGYLESTIAQVREAHDDKSGSVRLKWNRQRIFTSMLAGEHVLAGRALELNWRGMVSTARSETPDNTLVNIQGSHLATSNAATRRWERNSDRDLGLYVSGSYHLEAGACEWRLRAGAMYRDKRRDSFFNEYTFDSATGTESVQVYGKDWSNLDGLELTPRKYGNVGDPLNYSAHESVGAGWAMARLTLEGWDLTAGIRLEHTDQGYRLKYPRDTDPEGRQRYADWLPDLHAKRTLRENMYLHLSYYRAINRPGLFEIVPYSIINEDYKEKGNPDLRHAVADNVDLRWEFFPRSAEQFMVGLFYKHIADPIEYGLINEGQDTYYMPLNLGNASNMGVEIDVLKYFHRFGVKANYTFTHSRIKTRKRMMEGNEIVQTTQTRPLCGQAAHVVNLSLLYNDIDSGLEAQVTTSYIGKRLSEISNWADNDIWENGYFRLELSAEKSFGCGLSVFVKATNLLDLPMTRYYHRGPRTDSLQDVERVGGNVVERKERYGQTLMAGVRFKLN